MNYTFEMTIGAREAEIEIDAEVFVWRDGIGGYEYGGAPGWDTGDLCVEVESVDIVSAQWTDTGAEIEPKKLNKLIPQITEILNGSERFEQEALSV